MNLLAVAALGSMALAAPIDAQGKIFLLSTQSEITVSSKMRGEICNKNIINQGAHGNYVKQIGMPFYLRGGDDGEINP